MTSGTTSSGRSVGWWRRHLVGIGVVLWLATCCVAAIPDVGRADANALWHDPRIDDELSAWARALGVEPATFKSTLHSVARHGADARSALQRPFKPLLQLTGIRQAWVVFVAGTRQADRFEVVGTRLDGSSQALYRRGDDDAQWQASLIEGSRFRNATFIAAWPDGRGQKRRASVCRLLATRAFADDPALMSIRCGFLRRRNVKPGEGPIPIEQPTHQLTIPRPAAAADVQP
jgi:hypothetical protein